MHNLGNESLILARSHDTLPQWLTKMEPRLALCTTTLGNPQKLLDYLWESSVGFRSCQNLFSTVQKPSEFFGNWGYMDMKITPMWISKTTWLNFSCYCSPLVHLLPSNHWTVPVTNPTPRQRIIWNGLDCKTVGFLLKIVLVWGFCSRLCPPGMLPKKIAIVGFPYNKLILLTAPPS